VGSVVPVPQPLDTKGVVGVIADGGLELGQINLTIEPFSRRDDNVAVSRFLELLCKKAALMPGREIL